MKFNIIIRNNSNNYNNKNNLSIIMQKISLKEFMKNTIIMLAG